MSQPRTSINSSGGSTRGGVSRHASATLQRNALRRSAPAALPCYDYYEQKPHKAGPMGNVVLTNMDDLRPWLAVARPAKAKEAEKSGGYIVYYPAAETGTARGPPRYYRIPKPDEDVYEHSVYISRNSSTTNEQSEASSLKEAAVIRKDGSIYSSGNDGCTDEECSC